MPSEHDGWAKFKTEIGNGDFQAGVRAIDEAIKLLHDEYGQEILSIVLFGSFARKDRGYDDIDLFLVINQAQGSVHEVTRELAKRVFGRLFLDYGQLFSFIVYNKAQFQRLKDFLPLFDEVRRDGVLLYGEDLFT
ncbi:MAG: nucleotidyltransferase domain-containing protein [Anaerolineae bacterium]